MKRSLTHYLQISRIANELFNTRTGEELARIREHFGSAYSEAQLCALVVVGMVLRIFKLAPDPPEGSRNLHLVVSLLLQWLRSPDFHTSRRSLNPLDDLVDQGLRALDIPDA